MSWAIYLKSINSTIVMRYRPPNRTLMFVFNICNSSRTCQVIYPATLLIQHCNTLVSPVFFLLLFLHFFSHYSFALTIDHWGPSSTPIKRILFIFLHCFSYYSFVNINVYYPLYSWRLSSTTTNKFTAVGALRFKEIFDRNPNPTDEELSNIAEQLGCDKKVVKVKEYNTSK